MDTPTLTKRLANLHDIKAILKTNVKDNTNDHLIQSLDNIINDYEDKLFTTLLNKRK